MVRSKITYYTILTSECYVEIMQEIWARQATRAARIATGLPPDSPEPEQEELEPRVFHGKPTRNSVNNRPF